MVQYIDHQHVYEYTCILIFKSYLLYAYLEPPRSRPCGQRLGGNGVPSRCEFARRFQPFRRGSGVVGGSSRSCSCRGGMASVRGPTTEGHGTPHAGAITHGGIRDPSAVRRSGGRSVPLWGKTRGRLLHQLQLLVQAVNVARRSDRVKQ